MRAFLLPVLVVMLVVPAMQAQAPAPAPVTAFVNVSVIPMDRERVLAKQTVIVQGDRIIALGPATEVPVPKGAVQVDGREKFLIPGLADMHAHVPAFGALVRRSSELDGDRLRQLAESAYTGAEMAESEHMLALYLANGVTTVRIMHGAPEILTLRTRTAKGELFSPRIYVATPMLREVYRGLFSAVATTPFDGVESPAEAVEIVTRAKAMGYDLIKMYGVTGEQLDSLVATARRLNIPIAGHVPAGDNGLQEAIRVGYRSIEHLSGFLEYLAGADYSMQWNAEAVVDTTTLRTLATELRQAGVWNCPTFALLGINLKYFSQDSVLQRPEMRYYTPLANQKLRAKRGPAPSAEDAQLALQGMNAYRQIVRVLQQEGAGLLLGTDAAAIGVVPGFSIHRELEELVHAGLTPYQALETGTRNAAAYFETQDSTGTVAVGKRADLVLLSGNPLRDIRHTARPAGVMAGGRWFPRADLDARLKALEGTLDGDDWIVRVKPKPKKP